jgi:hypothetical protein
VLWVPQKYGGRSFAGKTVILFFLLFPSLGIKAQSGSPSIDSIKEIIEAPSEKKNEEVTTEEKEKKYFLERQEFTNAEDSLQLRRLPDSLVKKMQEDDDFWYANAILKKEKPKEASGDSSHIPLGQRSWFKTLLWLVIIGGFGGFIIWWLTGSNVGLFRKRQQIIANREEEEIITEDIFAINYQKEIDKAAQQGNYRLAVRLMFLRLLKDLSEKNIIQYKQELTNSDYLLQLNPTRYYTDFFRLTRNYEYSWYGLFDVPAEAYSIIKNDFNHFTNQLR